MISPVPFEVGITAAGCGRFGGRGAGSPTGSIKTKRLPGRSERLIGRYYLFEPLLCCLVALVSVGVILQGELSVGGFDLCLRGTRGYTKYLMVVHALFFYRISLNCFPGIDLTKPSNSMLSNSDAS